MVVVLSHSLPAAAKEGCLRILLEILFPSKPIRARGESSKDSIPRAGAAIRSGLRAYQRQLGRKVGQAGIPALAAIVGRVSLSPKFQVVLSQPV